MRLYISGPMSGHPELNFPAFFAAETKLRSFGFDVINPASIQPLDPAKSWRDYMREDIRALIDCEGVATLLGWGVSKGARLEVEIARMLGMTILPLEDWTKERAEAAPR